MSEIEIIGRFEPFSFQHETRAAPKQVVLSDDVEQRRCEQHVAEDEVDVCGEQGLDTDVVWSKGGVLVQSMKLPGVHHVIWTRFPKPFGRSLCVLHDHGTIMSVYSHNGATYCNPLLRPALSVWALDVSGGLLLETAGQDGSSGNGSVPMQESATSPTHASTGKRSLPGSPMDLLAASLPASPMSQAGDRALVECTPLLYVRHPLMSAQSVAHSSAPPLPHQDLQVAACIPLPVQDGAQARSMDVVVFYNRRTGLHEAYGLSPIPKSTMANDAGVPGATLQLLWRQPALPAERGASLPPGPSTVHAMAGMQGVLIALHYAEHHLLVAYTARLSLQAPQDGRLSLVFTTCAGVTVVDYFTQSAPIHLPSTFRPQHHLRLVVVDPNGNLQVYQHCSDASPQPIYQYKLPIPDLGRVTAISHTVGMRFNVNFSSGLSFRVQLKLMEDCPLGNATLDTLRCALPMPLMMQLETAWLQRLSVLKVDARAAAPGPGWSQSAWATLCDLLYPRQPSGPGQATPTPENDDSAWQALLCSGYTNPFAVGQCGTAPQTSEPCGPGGHPQMSGPDATLAEYYPLILVSLHLLYESCKLDIARWAWLRPLATLLLTVARHLQWPHYCLHYCTDWPDLLLQDGSCTRDLPGPAPRQYARSRELCAARVVHFAWHDDGGEPPSVYRWISQRIGGRDAPFPALRSGPDGTVPPTDTTRVVARLYDLLFSSDRTVYDRYAAGALYDPAVVRRHFSAADHADGAPDDDVEEHDAAGDGAVDPGSAHSGSERVVLGMAAEGCTGGMLDSLAFGVAQCLREAVFECRNMPIPSTHWPKEAYTLIGREDLAALCSPSGPPCPGLESMRTPDDPMDHDTESSTGCEVGAAGELGKFIWGDEGRLQLVQNMLSSTLPVRLNTPVDATAESARDQQAQLQRIANRILGISVGRGALTLSTIRSQPTENLRIQPIHVAGKRGKNEAMLKLDVSQIPADALVWPEFHNGCAVGLRLRGYNKPPGGPASPRPLSAITRDWILYHYPAQPTPANAGMLFALGLQGHLSALALTDVFRFMSVRHDPLTVAVLLGLAATYRGTMTAAITSMLSLHLAAITPAYPDLEVSLPVQTAALVGVGLLYQGSTHRFMSELLLGELGRSPSDEHCTNREGYAWAAGVALGLVCLGRGTSAQGLADLRLDDKLYAYMMGAPRANLFDSTDLDPDVMHDPDQAMEVIMRRKEPATTSQCSRILEGRLVNVSVTGAGATMALALMYLMTNNESVAARLAVPKTQYLLDYLTPNAALLRVLAFGVVMWDQCLPTEDWLSSNIPTVIRSAVAKAHHRAANKLLQTADEDDELDAPTGGLGHTLLMYSHMLAGGILTMGIRYAGTERTDVRDIMLAHLKGFMEGKSGSGGLPIVSATVSRASMDSCIHATVLAVACVMAGSGDYETLGILRRLWKREEANYGQHMAVGMAIGILFLGAGHFSLAKDPSAVAALLIACYPRFPSHPGDNAYHLQALRHLYTLAAVPSMLETRDVDTGMPCYLPVQVHLKKGATLASDSAVSRRVSGPVASGKTRLSMGDANVRANQLLFTPGGGRSTDRLSATGTPVLDRTAPCLMPPLEAVAKVVVKSPRYFPLFLETDNELHLQALLRGFTIFVKRRPGFLSYFDDPKGVRNLLSSRTITTKDSVYNTADAAAPGAGRKGVMPPLYSDPTTTLFAKYFGGGPRDPLFHRSAIQECLYNENTGMLTVYQWLYWSAAAVLNPGQWGPDTTTTCYTALMWNCRLIFTLYDTYSGPKSPCQGIFEEDTSTRIESGRLLSVDLVKAMRVMVEEQFWQLLEFVPKQSDGDLPREERSPCTYLSGLSLTPPSSPSCRDEHALIPLALYMHYARFPSDTHLAQHAKLPKMGQAAQPGGPWTGVKTLEQLRTLFGCALQYYDMPTPATGMAVLEQTLKGLLHCPSLSDKERAVLLVPIISKYLPLMQPMVVELLIRAITS